MSRHVMSCLGPYPSLVNNTAGHKTLVVQAYAHTKVGTVSRHWVVDNIVTHKHFIVIKAEVRPFIVIAMLSPVSGEAEAQVL